MVLHGSPAPLRVRRRGFAFLFGEAFGSWAIEGVAHEQEVYKQGHRLQLDNKLMNTCNLTTWQRQAGGQSARTAEKRLLSLPPLDSVSGLPAGL